MTKNLQHQNNISDEEIIAAARRLRDKQNSQLPVRPWQPRYSVAWYVAVPAACLVGFAFGFLLRPSVEVDTPQQPVAHTIVKVDTVIVSHVVRDTIYQTTNPHQPVRPRPLTASTSSASQEGRKIGISVLEDNIRYDLLAANHNEYY